MDKKKKDKSIGFNLLKITTEQFAIIPNAFNKNNHKVEMSIEVNFGIDKDNKIIASFIKVRFEQDKQAFIVIEVANHYKIEDKAWDGFNKSETGIVIPKGFASHLVMITVGTLRGTLHCKTENTDFNRFVLPAINVIDLVKNDIELN